MNINNYRLKKDTEIDEEIMIVKYDNLSNEEKEELINMTEFSINKNAKRENEEDNDIEELGTSCWKLVDGQGANYNNIENDEFKVGDYDSIINRLDIYFDDYNIKFE